MSSHRVLLAFVVGLLGCGRVGFDGIERDGGSGPDGVVDALGRACVASISTGDDHTCAIRTDGELYCWGGNGAGQLGIGTQAAAMTPVTVLPSGVELVFAGRDHTCAVVGTSLRCWGRNLDGELGDGTTLDRSTPADVVFPSGNEVSDGAAGTGFTCALVRGAAWCWGLNANGQLGDGTTTNHATPAPVRGGGQPLFSTLALGHAHACGLGTDETVWCWGANGEGQLGDGTFTGRSVPAVVPGLEAVALAAGGETTCVVATDGRVYCWGSDENGKLGDGEPRAGSAVPLAVTGIGPGEAVDVGVGPVHACAVLGAGGVRCWGRHNGRLGDGDPTPSLEYVPSPVTVLNETEAMEVTVGLDSTCVRRTSGQVDCWGQNDRGELGRGSLFSATSPTASGVLDSAQISMAGYHACSVSAAGTLVCWGSNGHGQLGVGGPTDEDVPQRVASGVQRVATGTGFTCAALASGQVQCWGASSRGRLGNPQSDGIPQLVPVTVAATPGLDDATSLATGNEHACAITSVGSVFCWGNNFAGALGDGTETTSMTPIAPMLPSNTVVTQVAGGSGHTCARVESGVIYCWGLGSGGRLGTGSTTSSTVPVMTAALPTGTWTAIAAGSDVSCATDTSNALYCWGNNADGDVGDGTTTNRVTPTRTLVATPVESFDVGNQLGCAVVAGVLSCWGEGAEGKLGDGTFDDRATPSPVVGLPAVANVDAGLGDHACALDTAGRVWCWGAGTQGQLGGERRDSPIPRAVDVPCP